MEMHEVRYFLAACETLNFHKAAARCHVTQSALTGAIQKLEAELASHLFRRERNHVQLTDFGRLMRPHLEAVLDRTTNAQQVARSFLKQEAAPLTLGVMCTIPIPLCRVPERVSRASSGNRSERRRERSFPTQRTSPRWFARYRSLGATWPGRCTPKCRADLPGAVWAGLSTRHRFERRTPAQSISSTDRPRRSRSTPTPSIPLLQPGRFARSKALDRRCARCGGSSDRAGSSSLSSTAYRRRNPFNAGSTD